jgi:ribosomal protein S18 acetylase RimI-like enzyme
MAATRSRAASWPRSGAASCTSRILWVARALRGKGHGQRLLAAAERRAIERGCRHVFLDTFNFQAPDFYVKQGYEIYARADDWPVGHSHFFLRKALPSPP